MNATVVSPFCQEGNPAGLVLAFFVISLCLAFSKRRNGASRSAVCRFGLPGFSERRLRLLRIQNRFSRPSSRLAVFFQRFDFTRRIHYESMPSERVGTVRVLIAAAESGGDAGIASVDAVLVRGGADVGRGLICRGFPCAKDRPPVA